MASRSVEDRPSRAFKASKRYRSEIASLGVRIKSFRIKRHWTLEEASERMHLDLKHLQKIESGSVNVTLVTLVRIADGLGIPVGALFVSRKRTR